MIKKILVAASLVAAATSAFADDCTQETKVVKPAVTHTKHVKKHTGKVHKTSKPKVKAIPIVETKTVCEAKKPEKEYVEPFPFPPPGDIIVKPMPLPVPQVTTVPEPSTIFMVMAGLLSLTFFTRRRK